MKMLFKWVQKWWDLSRATYLIPVLLPVILVSLVAHSHGTFDWMIFLLIILGVSFLGLGCYMINDYFDFRSGVDEKKESFLSWAGLNNIIYRQSNPIIDGRISPHHALFVSVLFFTLSVPMGVFLVLKERPLVLVFGITGFLIAYLYSAPPFDLSSHKLGEIFPGIAYGPLAMMGTYYTFTGHLNLEVLILSLPVGLYVSLVRWVDAIPGYKAHREVGETKLTVVLGPRKAAFIVPILVASIYLSIIVCIFGGIIPWTMAIVLLSLPLGMKVIRLAIRFYDKPEQYMPAIPGVLKGYTSMLLLMMVGYELYRFI